MSDPLHLDGIFLFKTTIEDSYIRDNNGKTSSSRKHFWSRVTAIAQMALCLAVSIVRQTVRGLVNLAVSILTVDKERFIFAIKDFASIIIQTIALPVLGIIATGDPRTLLRAADWACKKFNPSLKKNGADSTQFVQTFVEQQDCCVVPRSYFVAFLERCTVSVQSVALGIWKIVAPILAFDFSSGKLMSEGFMHIVASPFIGFMPNTKQIKELHGLNVPVAAAPA